MLNLKKLTVKKVDTEAGASWNEINKSLEGVEWNLVNVVNWKQYAYRPWVQFKLAYSSTEFLLQYRVREKYIRAVAAHDNGEVWKDSCVEFFVTPADDGAYYNFEFNCAGVCLMAVGTGRNGREWAPLDLLSRVRRFPSLGRSPFQERTGEVEWDLTIAIPFGSFFKHPGIFPPKECFKANFYKCGDDLREPHFLSWHPVEAENPDFHRPECFGTVCPEK
ncbi:MAG: hypothetical protein LBF89_00570 [Bacteroidales bacterium]|jgi:hypothetical protein|nr:hypothetical protein [Bacteroidales bacterium]